MSYFVSIDECALVTGDYSNVKKFGNAQNFYAQVSKTDRQIFIISLWATGKANSMAKIQSLWYFVLNI